MTDQTDQQQDAGEQATTFRHLHGEDCVRYERGKAFTTTADCNCGLDAFIAAARDAARLAAEVSAKNDQLDTYNEVIQKQVATIVGLEARVAHKEAEWRDAEKEVQFYAGRNADLLAEKLHLEAQVRELKDKLKSYES
jgi:chromosome segregation ATPase